MVRMEPCSENQPWSGVQMTESDFSANAELSLSYFSRDGASGINTQDLIDCLSYKKVSRSSTISHIHVTSDNDLVLVTDRTNLRSRYGFDVGKEAHVYPEEALYLLECGKAEIYKNHVPLSIQRARSLLLVPSRPPHPQKLTQCTHEEYLVYKCLSKKGYALYRHKPESTPKQMETDDEVIVDDKDHVNEIIELDGVGSGRQDLKRKYPEEEDVDDNESMDEVVEEDLEEPYTVDEADSDVEIVDEVIFSHGGVEIQEIGHAQGCGDFEMGDEPVASTSRGPVSSEVLVDLVSSEDEDEEFKTYASTVWTKFIPNSRVSFKMPPSKLIPSSIPLTDKSFEFDLKDKSDISDLELEYLVDEVSLSDDKYGGSPETCINLPGVRTWKEWRQNIFQEARVVMNNSLLGSSEYIDGEAAVEKLCLWGDHGGCGGESGVVFEMYGPVGHGWSRKRAFEGGALYYVVISRQDEAIPDFGVLGSSINGVPILVAVVCDSGENDVLFMTADRSPLNSLF